MTMIGSGFFGCDYCVNPSDSPCSVFLSIHFFRVCGSERRRAGLEIIPVSMLDGRRLINK